MTFLLGVAMPPTLRLSCGVVNHSRRLYSGHMSTPTPGPFRIATAPTVSRGRRCQNCRTFDNGPAAIQLYKERRTADVQRRAEQVLEQAGTAMSASARRQLTGDFDQATMDALGLNYELGDQYINAGVLGTCVRGTHTSTFIHAMFLCTQWTEKYRPDGSEQHDELPAEARANRDMDD